MTLLSDLSRLSALATKGKVWAELSSDAGYGWDLRADDLWIAHILGDHREENGPPHPSFPSREQAEANARLICDLVNSLPEILEMARNDARLKRENEFMQQTIYKTLEQAAGGNATLLLDAKAGFQQLLRNTALNAAGRG